MYIEGSLQGGELLSLKSGAHPESQSLRRDGTSNKALSGCFLCARRWFIHFLHAVSNSVSTTVL